MSDNKKETGKPDDSRINIHQAYELHDWSKKLGVTPDALRDSVKRVGPMVKDVKRDLGK